MLLTTEANSRNQRQALVAAGLVAWAAGLLGWLSPPLWLLLGLSPLTYWWVRQRCLRRMTITQQPFSDNCEQILRTHVAFFEALDEAGKVRFRQLVQIFLDEVRITGIRTEVDETIRVRWRRVRRSLSSVSTIGDTTGSTRYSSIRMRSTTPIRAMEGR